MRPHVPTEADPSPTIVPYLSSLSVHHLYTLIDEGFPDPPAMDVAVSHSILESVSRGDMGGVFRLHVPATVVAFGLADRVVPGYRHAVRAAEAHGYGAVERLAGGRAAVFHERTLAFSWAVPDPEPRANIRERFEAISSVMVEAFETLGIDARVGEVPGEYCPGKWSVNVGGRVKVMGVGQRLVRGAAHVGGVVVVEHGHRVRDVLIPVYRALGLDWDPRTAGALADRSPGIDTPLVARAIINSFANRFRLVRGDLPQSTLASAEDRLSTHLPEQV